MIDKTDKRYFSYQITKRFLNTADKIIGSRKDGKKITAKMFGDTIGIASSNLNRIRQNPTENFVTIEALGRLCHFYNISPDSILLFRENDDSIMQVIISMEKGLSTLKNRLK